MKPKRSGQAFNARCKLCPRLSTFLGELQDRYPAYHNAPVAPFGPSGSRLLIVGLAPGMHGANASGRPFTGDHAGIMLYQTLHRHGFASASESRHRRDGLTLNDCRITNAVKCLPPANKPVGSEVNNCNRFLQRDISDTARPGVVLALGGVAHRAVLKALELKQSHIKFGHGATGRVAEGLVLVSSYHCSRYNTQTRRLTQAMFDEVFVTVRTQLRGARES